MSKDNNKINPSILPGFMELLPKEQLAFNKMLDSIKESYELFGFVPLDTPIIEKAEVLLAKSGEETERQIYKFTKGDNEMALRFDLTVPLARYVAEHMHDLNFPFRRYQIGKVYRGEKPQKGRFREFYQCDIDIIGRGELDLVNDAEILAVIFFTFSKLGLGDFQIRLNNRKILAGFMTHLGLKESSALILRMVDKIDKIGKESVKEELIKLDISQEKVDSLLDMLSLKGSAQDILSSLESFEIKESTYLQGLDELKTVVEHIEHFEIPQTHWNIDLTIARGLDYYTGTVYETILTEYADVGSICSGGRYDNLAEYYTDEKLPGVGISIGLTRLFYKLDELGLFNKDSYTPSQVLIVTLDIPLKEGLGLATKFRSNSISTEVYTEHFAKLKKKMDYANKIGVPYVAIIGENEVKDGKVTLKNMQTGEQAYLSASEAIKQIKN